MEKLVTREHRPSNINQIRQDIFGIPEVKGAATLASACERDTPTCAALRACKKSNLGVNADKIQKRCLHHSHLHHLRPSKQYSLILARK